MRRKRIRTGLLVLLLSLSLIFPGVPKVHAVTVSEATVLETDVAAAAEGCTMLGVYGSYYSQAQEALDKLNAIRKEACEAGNVPDPRNSSRMLSPSDYHPLKWSRDLESVARIRAAEGGIAYAFMDSGHDRLNNRGTFSVSYNKVSSYAEDLAYYWKTDMVEGILLWYGEKKDWVNQAEGKVTGHYTSMINPNYTYVGLGDFYSEAAKYPNTLAGEFSYKSELDETMQEAPTEVMQKMEVSNSYIQNFYLDGNQNITTDQKMTVTPKAHLQRKKAKRDVWMIGPFDFTSSDPEVANVDDSGVVTGITAGTTTITARSEDGTQEVSLEVTVHCNHARTLQSYTPPTCVHTGEKVYYCATCGKSISENLPKTAHDYVYGEVGADQKATGVCSVCQDTITIVPPTQYDIYWCNSASDSDYYTSYLPAQNPVNSVLYCWPQVQDGDSEYRDIVVESTDTEMISVPDSLTNNDARNALRILTPGITTLTVYPKYNPRVKKTYTLRAGTAGSVDLSQAEVVLSEDTYTYTGRNYTPQVTVTYNGTVLQRGIDYTLQYENNQLPGEARAIIEGKGIFAGRVEKTFTIQGTVSDTHTHTPVVDEKVEPTCTTPGRTQGSHCAECGEVITAQQPIAATGHRYVNGKCSVCGAVKDKEQDNSQQEQQQGQEQNQQQGQKQEKKQTQQKNQTRQDAGNTVNSDSFSADTNTNASSISTKTTVKKGDSFVVKGFRYRVTAVAGTKTAGKVTCVGSTQKSLKSAAIPKQVTHKKLHYTVTGIGKNAFAGQNKLQSVTIPTSVTQIGARAFFNCTKLKKVKINSSKLTRSSVGKKAFYGIAKKVTVIVPRSKKAEYRKWFLGKGLRMDI